MHHYPHHIGDFNGATRHLTRLERSIYRDLMDLYYDTEKPLPLDRKILCRKILARDEQESTAVEQVLNEFFTETEQGWFHDRCEIEIKAFHDNITAKSLAGKASAAKREAEKLARLAELNRSSTVVQQDFNRNPTALNSVDNESSTNSNQPEPEPEPEPEPVKSAAAPEAPNSNPAARSPAVELSIAMRKAGINTQPADPRLIALAAQGVTPETVTAACEEAQRAKPGEQVGAGYVFKILERWAADAGRLKVAGAAPPKAAGGAWWASDTSILAKGAELHMHAHMGESPANFRGRIQAEIDGTTPVRQMSKVTEVTPDGPRRVKPEGLNLRALVGPARELAP